jgi:NTE family protein
MASGEEGRADVLVDLALQGGGSHGAFTWGVLDRLLEEPWLKIEAISGTSAGAMNGAVLVSGFMQGGTQGARAALDAYWRRVADAARFSPIQRSPLDRLMNRWSLDTSPAYLMMDLMSRVFSPYSLNPFGVNPISDILRDSIDFAHLGEASIKLFITATNVHTADSSGRRNTVFV